MNFDNIKDVEYKIGSGQFDFVLKEVFDFEKCDISEMIFMARIAAGRIIKMVIWHEEGANQYQEERFYQYKPISGEIYYIMKKCKMIESFDEEIVLFKIRDLMKKIIEEIKTK